MKIKDLNVQHIVDFKTNLENHFTSLNSARTVFSNFKILVNHSINFFGLKVNPTLMVDPIKRTRPKINFIKREEFEERVQHLDLHHYKELTRLLFYTGLRIGEALALTWNDIDLEKNQLYVNKTLDFKTRQPTSPKTAGSEGYVPFPRFISEMLLSIKKNPKKRYSDSRKTYMCLMVYHHTITVITTNILRWFFKIYAFTICAIVMQPT